MYAQDQLQQIAIQTATYKPPNSNYAPSPVIPHVSYSNEWSITQTPIIQSCQSPSFDSNHSGTMFTLDAIPPDPSIPKNTSVDKVPQTQFKKQWSIQESIPALSPKTSYNQESQSQSRPHTMYMFPINAENKTDIDNVYNIDTTEYEPIENIDTPLDDATPQPSTYAMHNPENPPLMNNKFPAAFPRNKNYKPNRKRRKNKINKKQNDPTSPKSFKTISDSESNEDSSDSSTDSSSTGSGTTDDDTEQSYTDSEWNQINDDMALTQYGYKILKKICTTIHGCVYEAKIVDEKDENGNNNNKIKGINKPRNSIKLTSQTASLKNCFNLQTLQRVAVKKVDKKMVEINNKVTNNSNDENIMKEAIILNYLSVLNKPPSDNICEFIDFIETDTDCYLIQEYGGSQTLAHFVKIAHQYISQKKLKLKHWRITVKFVFWQLSVMTHWMHNDMNVCHLDLNTDNILIKNGDFFLNQKDGTITVDSKNLSVKISDFGFAEIFPFEINENNVQNGYSNFTCAKHGLTKDHAHKSPQQYNGQTFDARKTDCYSLGVILYEMLTGSKPYSYPSDTDKGYLALQTKELANYLATNGLSKHVYRSTLTLVEGLTNISEEERMSTPQILTHEWFKHYYDRYKIRIEQKTKSQKTRHQRQAKKIKVLPYYMFRSMNRKHSVL